MIRFKLSLLLCLALLGGCIKRYKFTAQVCDKRLFVEVFETNPAGVYSDYLTDSVSFRKYIGDCDEEHDWYSYTCSRDSINILKRVKGNRWAKWDTASNGTISLKTNLDMLENYNLSLSDLKKLNNYR
jgi:hypothetical protein